MTKCGIALAAVWACGTFALVLAVGLPASLNAVDQPVPIGGKVTRPTLKVNGIEFSIELASPTTQPSDQSEMVPGQPMQIKLIALNTGDSKATADYSVQLYGMPVASLARRSMPMPNQIWKQDGQVALDAKGTTMVSLTTASIPVNQIVSLRIVSGKNQIEAMQSAVKLPVVMRSPAATTQPGDLSANFK